MALLILGLGAVVFTGGGLCWVIWRDRPKN